MQASTITGILLGYLPCEGVLELQTTVAIEHFIFAPEIHRGFALHPDRYVPLIGKPCELTVSKGKQGRKVTSIQPRDGAQAIETDSD